MDWIHGGFSGKQNHDTFEFYSKCSYIYNYTFYFYTDASLYPFRIFIL